MSDDSSEATLIVQLEKAPLTEVTGIVDANGSGGGMLPGDDQWKMTFTFVAWRQEHHRLNTNELIVRRKVSDEELKSFMNSIKPDSIIRIRAKVLEDNIWGRPEALLDAVVGEYSRDIELNDFLTKRKKPVTYMDARFGEFTLDRTVDWFSGKTKWNESIIDLNLKNDVSGNVQAALQAAYELWQDSANWDQRIRDCIARDLLPLKSQNWTEDDGSIVSREQFEARMKLRSITVRADGSFDADYDDDDLFWGHDIVVYGSLNGGVTSAGIQG